MSANGISWLPTKEQRQIAKLNLAAAKRGESYNVDLLPTKYVGNDVYNNPNPGGLEPHRPWISNTSPTTYTVRQYLYSYTSGNGASSIFVLDADYPNAANIPVGATATINGTPVVVTANTPSSAIYFNGGTGRQIDVTPNNIVTSGTSITFSWTT